MVEANAPVGGRIEERAPQQSLAFVSRPVGQDWVGVENVFRAGGVERLLGGIEWCGFA